MRVRTYIGTQARLLQYCNAVLANHHAGIWEAHRGARALNTERQRLFDLSRALAFAFDIVNACRRLVIFLDGCGHGMGHVGALS